jgi:purine nucleosidase
VTPAPLYFDCDTGVDDTMALLFLLEQPTITVVGIGTVSGNVSAEQAARNTLDVAALAGYDVPVAIGSHDHLTHPFEGGPAHIHGANGVGDADLPDSGRMPVAEHAADMIVRLAHEYPGELRLVAVGPLTNLALALQRDPELPSLVKDVTIMGGAATVAGNMSPSAEANIGNDPEAAAAVFDAAWPLTMVGLDVTLEHRITEEDRARLLASDRPVAQFVAATLDIYYDFYVNVYGERCAALHDPLAVAVAVGAAVPTLAPVVRAVVDTTDGPNRGRTTADLRGRKRGYPVWDDARTTVVLEIAEPFAPLLIDTILAI